MTITVATGPTDHQVMSPRSNLSTSNGIAVTFSKLTYSVPLKKKQTLTILNELSGVFLPGQMTALMGPSGSGKTTLMDILAGRKRGAGKIEGEVLYGGSPASFGTLKHLCGYVEQFDTLIAELTVEQMLMYTAELKMPSALGKDKKREQVEEVISKLRLQKCRDTMIGNALARGISGGQAKRVNIALALITRPRVIFLDEPTSGLDSKMANQVCQILKDLTKDGRTVVATVHSPTSFAFSLFDELMMLAAGGAVIYAGTVSAARSHFESCGFAFPREGGYSFPDWLVDTTSGATGVVLDDEAATDPADAVDFASVWAKSEGCKAYGEALSEAMQALKANPVNLHSLPTTGPGQLKALRTLLTYRMLTHYKSGEFMGPRFGDKIFMAIIAMTLYWGIGDNMDAQSLQSVSGVLFFFSALCGYGAAAFVPSLTMERPLFFRERADGCYCAVTYYFSKFVEEAILAVFTSLLFSVCVFFAMSLQGSFLVFWIIYFLTTMVGIVLAYAVAAVSPTMEAANALLPTYVTTCMYFGGLIILFDKIPDGWKWYSWTSFLRYSWGAFMINQFQDGSTGALKVFFDDEGNQVTILEFYGLEEGIMNSLGGCIGILTGLCLLFGVFGALGLTYVQHIKR